MLSRRLFLAVPALALSGCVRSDVGSVRSGVAPDHGSDPRYAAMPDERFPIDAVDTSRMDPELLRQLVPFRTQETVGTIVVDPQARFLYLVQERGLALRYGVGVGRDGLEWSGRALLFLEARRVTAS